MPFIYLLLFVINTSGYGSSTFNFIRQLLNRTVQVNYHNWHITRAEHSASYSVYYIILKKNKACVYFYLPRLPTGPTFYRWLVVSLVSKTRGSLTVFKFIYGATNSSACARDRFVGSGFGKLFPASHFLEILLEMPYRSQDAGTLNAWQFSHRLCKNLRLRATLGSADCQAYTAARCHSSPRCNRLALHLLRQITVMPCCQRISQRR